MNNIAFGAMILVMVGRFDCDWFDKVMVKIENNEIVIQFI